MDRETEDAIARLYFERPDMVPRVIGLTLNLPEKDVLAVLDDRGLPVPPPSTFLFPDRRLNKVGVKTACVVSALRARPSATVFEIAKECDCSEAYVSKTRKRLKMGKSK